MHAIVYTGGRIWRFNIKEGEFVLYRLDDATDKEYAIYFNPVWAIYVAPYGDPSKNLNRELRVGAIKFFDDNNKLDSGFITRFKEY